MSVVSSKDSHESVASVSVNGDYIKINLINGVVIDYGSFSDIEELAKRLKKILNHMGIREDPIVTANLLGNSNNRCLIFKRLKR